MKYIIHILQRIYNAYAIIYICSITVTVKSFKIEYL